MKVLLYEQARNALKKSGIGRALHHQKKALELHGVETTFNRTDTYDLVHINSSFKSSARFMRSLQKKGIPVLVHGHSTEEDFRHSFRAWRQIAPWHNRNLKRIYGNADLIVTPTPYSKRLIENYPYVSCPVFALSNGIDLEEYAPNSEAVQAFVDYFKIEDGEKIIIGVGLPFVRKGLLDFIEVARQLPDITFIWFGHLPKIATQGKVLRTMRKKPNNLIFPGYISGPIIRGAFQKADALLFPSYEETEGIVVLEALASYLPVIVRDVPVYYEWLKAGDNCFKGENVDDFVRIINALYEMDVTAMVEEGYQIAQARSLEKVGQGLIEIYRELIKITKTKKEK